MRRAIRVCIGDVVAQGELHGSPTATRIWEALPIEGQTSRWGDEIYFGIPVVMDLDDTAHEVVERGDVGYWPQGRALCIFFGPTPVSHGDEIRPASAVNLVGKMEGDLRIFKEVQEGMIVRLEKEQKVTT
jgi:hypothetical protein